MVDSTLAEVPMPDVSNPNWERYGSDYREGVPLLHSADAAVDLTPTENVVATFVAHLGTLALPGRLREEVATLDSELRISPENSQLAVKWLVNGDSFTPSNPGLTRFFGWIALARYLAPLVIAYSSWRDEEQWLRHYCPTCGSRPAMAQLVGVDPGRLRLLSCSFCSTRWRYRRTGCPFCETADDHKLSVLSVDGEAGLRIDYCQYCSGYIKTYVGQGDECILLADWTSLHLDVLALDRGLKRLSTSLYEL